MTEEGLEFVREFADLYRPAAVLEIGSYGDDGARRLFPRADYTGIDMRAGPNVNHVMNAHSLGFCQNSFNAVLCLEMLEHDSHPQQTLNEIARVLAPGGYVVLTTRSWRYFPPHRHPNDYWRFLPEGLECLLTNSPGLHCLRTVDSIADSGVFALGMKP